MDEKRPQRPNSRIETPFRWQILDDCDKFVSYRSQRFIVGRGAIENLSWALKKR